MINKNKYISIVALSNIFLHYGSIFNVISILFILGINLFELKRKSKIDTILWILIFLIAALGLLSIFSLSLALALIVFISFFKSEKYRTVGLIVLASESSIIQNLNGYLFNIIAIPEIQILITIFTMLIVFSIINKNWIWLIYSVTSITIISYILISFLASIILINTILSLITLAFIFYDERNIKNVNYLEYVIFILIFISIISFFRFNILTNESKIFYLLPSDEKSYESKFFENYENALKFSQLDSQEFNDISEIPARSIILIPWITDKDSQFKLKLDQIKQTDKKLNIIIAAEHTNYAGSMKLINSLIEDNVVNDDLTVPINNSDNSGYLRSIELDEWSPRSIFNRGASLNPRILDKTILSADLWHLERNYGDWLWVGDYIWQPSDKVGRVPLAILKQAKNKTFLITGDNSFLINKQIISNPSTLLKMNNYIKIYPLLYKDILLLLFSLLIVMNSQFITILISILFFTHLCLMSKNYSRLDTWRGYDLGYSGFDDREFSLKLLGFNELFEKDYKIYRKEYLDKKILEKKENAIIFGLVRNELKTTQLFINDCFRAGNIKFKEAYIMDGQFCNVIGGIDQIVSDDKRTYIFKIKLNGFYKIIILDKEFISNRAPDANLELLKKII